MSLPPLNRQAFIRSSRRLVDHSVTEVDWSAALTSYEWRGDDWETSLGTRHRFGRLLREPCDESELAEAAQAVLTWGGLPPLNSAALGATIRTFPALDDLARSGAVPGAALHARRIASVSKVYAMYAPLAWAIYDSRVARALAGLVSDSAMSGPQFRFPQPEARSGDPFPGFPRLGHAAEAQARRAFVYASWLSVEIAQHIDVPCPTGGAWSVQEVEMALFMLGDPRTATKGKAMSRGEAGPTGRAKTKTAMAAGATFARGGGISPGGVAAAGVAVVARQVWNDELAQALARDQILARIEQLQAKPRAARFALQTGSQVAHVQFADGPQRWTVFKEGTPIATFPPYLGDLDIALAYHDPDQLEMRTAESLQAEVDHDREQRRVKLPGRKRRESDEGVDDDVGLLDAGDG